MPRTSVKIWQRSALEAGGERDGRRVGAAAAEGRGFGAPRSLACGAPVVIPAERGLAHALEPGHDHDLALRELGADAGGVDVGDPGPAVAAVRRDARLRAGQGDRRHAERVEGHRDERGALVLAGCEKHVELAAIGIVGDGACASEISSSVVSPIADTTTTSWLPLARSRAIRRATRRIRSASASDEPPNFCTTSGAGMAGILQRAPSGRPSASHLR